MSVNPDNFLYPSGTYGAVLGFSVISGELYAFMKRGVIKITLTGEDTEYSLKDCGVAPFKVVDKTFKSTGDETYFIGINGLNRFNGKRVQKLKSMLDGIKYDISGEAQVSDNLYLLPITVNGTRKIYCYDVINEKDCLIKNDSLIAGKNAVSPTTGSIGEITTVNSNRKWVSVSTDLNKVGKKTLYSLSLDSEKDVSVQVSGDGITRSFTLGKNHPEAHPLIRAEKFIFTFTTADENQKSVISNVVAKYRI